MTRFYALFDRDGTLIKECHYLSRPDKVSLLPGVAVGLRRLQESNIGLAVVSNQSGIGRGFFTISQVEKVNCRLRKILASEGVTLNGIYVCPHIPEDNCDCRKPATGLVRKAVKELNFDPRSAFIVGDRVCDIELGHRVGSTTILVRTGYGEQEKEMVTPDYTVGDMNGAVSVILNSCGLMDL